MPQRTGLERADRWPFDERLHQKSLTAGVLAKLDHRGQELGLVGAGSEYDDNW